MQTLEHDADCDDISYKVKTSDFKKNHQYKVNLEALTNRCETLTLSCGNYFHNVKKIPEYTGKLKCNPTYYYNLEITIEHHYLQ